MFYSYNCINENRNTLISWGCFIYFKWFELKEHNWESITNAFLGGLPGFITKLKSRHWSNGSLWILVIGLSLFYFNFLLHFYLEFEIVCPENFPCGCSTSIREIHVGIFWKLSMQVWTFSQLFGLQLSTPEFCKTFDTPVMREKEPSSLHLDPSPQQDLLEPTENENQRSVKALTF